MQVHPYQWLPGLRSKSRISITKAPFKPLIPLSANFQNNNPQRKQPNNTQNPVTAALEAQTKLMLQQWKSKIFRQAQKLITKAAQSKHSSAKSVPESTQKLLTEAPLSRQSSATSVPSSSQKKKGKTLKNHSSPIPASMPPTQSKVFKPFGDAPLQTEAPFPKLMANQVKNGSLSEVEALEAMVERARDYARDTDIRVHYPHNAIKHFKEMRSHKLLETVDKKTGRSALDYFELYYGRSHEDLKREIDDYHAKKTQVRSKL